MVAVNLDRLLHLNPHVSGDSGASLLWPAIWILCMQEEQFNMVLLTGNTEENQKRMKMWNLLEIINSILYHEIRVA